ncbi:MAG TPA: IS66 family insertion sequence element accessory protein TnpB [Clostridia bacterium]|nr:IS66 family insertion sequence element accessory protein TnpB [Clostridia bacterium]
MLKDIFAYDGIYLACGATDLRKSVDGLALLVKEKFNLDPFGNYLFLFCNRNRNRLKALTWDQNGFVLYYKRLDGAGARFKWPKDPGKVRNITVKQLRLLMEGFTIDPPKGFGEITARDFY